MVFKQIYKKNGITGRATGSAYITNIYTVPASKILYIKEIIIMAGAPAVSGTELVWYVNPNGQTDLDTTVTSYQTATFYTAASTNLPIKILAAASSEYGNPFVLARNTVLVAGDSIKCRMTNNTAGNQNEYWYCQISGDET